MFLFTPVLHREQRTKLNGVFLRCPAPSILGRWTEEKWSVEDGIVKLDLVERANAGQAQDPPTDAQPALSAAG